jgi:hypothetical protein
MGKIIMVKIDRNVVEEKKLAKVYVCLGIG